ncbi:MAG: Tm-1-like ATP-binding domain-containing protein [Armatimonadetes bacterium]|nr:Tm-1-like ATP-binding domain-containing protein [Armatimonadota bacterium]
MTPTVAVVGTLDTKGQEFAFLCEVIREQGCTPLLLDCGVMGEPFLTPDLPREEIARAAGEVAADLRSRGDRGAAVEAMARGAAQIVRQLYEDGKIQGIVSLGGSAGTTIGTAAMRALPFGVPKLMVSTLASGNTEPYVGTRDVTMMYSVVDIAGINRVSREVIRNAGGAICGMVKARAQAAPQEDRPILTATMFGVTTPCVTRAREKLEAAGYEVLVFHATGTGGRAMEDLIRDGLITGVLDVTTTELADELVGGVFSAGPDRLEIAGEKGIPQVVAPGALDMVNFGPMESVPERFRDRRLYVHNPTVTLMRTTPDEMADLGKIIAGKLNAANGPVTFFLPLRGVSAIDRTGQPFDGPEADEAFRSALKSHLSDRVKLVEVDSNINDPEFADAMVEELLHYLKESS